MFDYGYLDSITAWFCAVKAILQQVVNGDEGTRTHDLCLAKAPLSQLSYIPKFSSVGLIRLELMTSRLSGVRSNQLSYRPVFKFLSV